MALRARVSVTLREQWLIFLRWIAADRAELPAELARRALEDALERLYQEPGVRARYDAWLLQGGDDPRVAVDVVRALSVDGVANVLAGDTIGAPQAALQAARFLQLLNAYLADPAPAGLKGEPPALDTTGWRPVNGAPVDQVLDFAGHADGAAVRAAAGDGRLMASDKRGLSDTGPEIAPEGASLPSTQARHERF